MRLAARYADTWNSLGGQPLSTAAGGSDEQVSLAAAAATTRKLNSRLDAAYAELGRDRASIKRSVLAYRTPVDPLSSPDAFDEFVDYYREAGIDECIFYWPPVANVLRREPIPAVRRATCERIAAERMPKYRQASVTS